MSLPRGLSANDVQSWFAALVPGEVRWKGYQTTCRSPLRVDKNASFSFNAEKGTWHDFATDEKGGLRELADRLGVAPPWDEGEKGSLPQPKANGFRQLWNSAQPADAGHLYLAHKHISFPEGLRQSGEVLLVPCYDDSGELVGVERIWPDGKKAHLGQKTGTFPFGKLEPGSPVVLAEGFATGASLHEATSLPVLCCFGASGIRRTAEALLRKHPKLEIIAAADNDEAGRRAAQESGGLAVIPDGQERYDWNDFAKEHGPEETKRVFMQKLEVARRAVETDPKSRLRALRGVLQPERGTTPEMIGGVFPRGGVSVLAGPQGRGKSVLLQRWCGDISLGEEVLYGVAEGLPARKVLYFTGELPKNTMDDRARLTGWRFNKERFVIYSGLDAAKEDIPLDIDGDGLENVRAIIEDERPDLVLFDSLMSFVSCDESDMRHMRNVFATLSQIADRANCAVLVVHHVRKRKSVERKERLHMDDVVGSGIITRYASLGLVVDEAELSDGKKWNVVYCCKTWYKPLDDFAFRITRDEYGNLRGIEVDRAPEEAGKAMADRIETTVFSKHGDGELFSVGDIVDEAGASRRHVLRVLQKMAEGKKLTVEGEGRWTKYRISLGHHATWRIEEEKPVFASIPMRHKVSEDGAYGTLKNKSLCATESLCAMPMAHRDRCSARDEVLYAPHGMILENGDSDGAKGNFSPSDGRSETRQDGAYDTLKHEKEESLAAENYFPLAETLPRQALARE